MTPHLRPRPTVASRGAVLVAMLFAFATSGCSRNEGYGITVTFQPTALRAQAATVELFVVPACGTLATTGATPVDALVSRSYVITSTMGTDLGSVRAGRYGLYGRARDTNCAIFAAGCVTFDVHTGATMGSAIALALTPVVGPRCLVTERCVNGTCTGAVATDAGDVGGCSGPTCSCPTGLTRCGTSCVDVRSDPANCGSCGTSCSGPHSTGTCSSGTCTIECAGGYRDCDGNPSNGCEASLDADSSCGACGTVCTGGDHCVARTCQAGCGSVSSPCCTNGCVAGAFCDFASINDAGTLFCAPCNATVGETCCGFTSCASGLACTQGSPGAPTTCQASCGGRNEPCCVNARCDAGMTCFSNRCEPCGGDGQPCCTATGAAPYTCDSPLVCTGSLRCGAACGASGQACCANAPTCATTGTACDPSTATCERCGQLGQVCCAGTTRCSSGECSIDQRCVSGCGSTGQPCCAITAGATCNAGLGCLDDHTCGNCGDAGETCCADFGVFVGPRCTFGSVCNVISGPGNCVRCGNTAGAPCCPADFVGTCTGTGLVCTVDATCATGCGSNGQPCCAAFGGVGSCSGSSVCGSTHTCGPCGSQGQPCCPGGMCSSGTCNTASMPPQCT